MKFAMTAMEILHNLQFNIYDFLAGNNYPNLPHSQRGMKFATQISPLLNLVNTFYDLFRHIYVSLDSPDSHMKVPTP